MKALPAASRSPTPYTSLVPVMFVKLPLPVGDPIKLPFLTLYYIGQAQGPSLSEARSTGLRHGPENRRTVLGHKWADR